MLARVHDLVGQNEFEAAAPLVTDVLSRYPENADAWFLMGSIYHARGEFQSAVAHYQQASQLNSNHQRAAMGEALALLDWGRQEQGVDRLQQIVNQYPFSLGALYFYAKGLKKLGRTAEAETAVRKASDMVNAVIPADLGDDPGQLLLAATIAHENGQYESAYGFLSKYLEREPRDLRANKRLASLLVTMGKPSEASRLLTRLKVNNPDDPGLLVMLGDVNSNLHDYITAELYYQAALEKFAANPALIGRLGLSQLRQGQTDAAIDTFQRWSSRAYRQSHGVVVSRHAVPEGGSSRAGG